MSFLKALYQREQIELRHAVPFATLIVGMIAGLSLAGQAGYTIHTTGTLSQGPDISRWQGQLSGSFFQNTAFVLVKAGGADGGLYEDSQFTRNWGLAKTYAAHRGAYFFASPGSSSATTQADYFASLVESAGFGTGDAAMLDLETGSGDLDGFASTFLARASADLGVQPLIYVSLGFLGGHLTQAGAYHLDQYPLDLADWYYGSPPSAPAPWPSLSLWQWTDSGSWNGVSPVDLNYQISGTWPGKPAPPPPGPVIPSAPSGSESWQPIPGSALDLGAGSFAAAVGTNAAPGGDGLWKWSGSAWSALSGAGSRVAVSATGQYAVANAEHQLWLNAGNGWVHLPGAGQDVAFGADQTLYAIGTDPQPGGYGIWHWQGGTWQRIPGGGVRIAAGLQPAVVNDSGQIWLDSPTGWGKLSGCGRDIAVAPDGSLWVIGCDGPYQGGYGIWHLTSSGWVRAGGAAISITVDSGGAPWVSNSADLIYRGS